jgi:hypothetical protein
MCGMLKWIITYQVEVKTVSDESKCYLSFDRYTHNQTWSLEVTSQNPIACLQPFKTTSRICI